IIQGQKRFRFDDLLQEDPYFTARVQYIEENFPDPKSKEVQGLVHSLKDAAATILKLNPEIPQEAQVALDTIDSPSFLTHFLSSNMNVEVALKQSLLEIDEGMARGTKLLEMMMKEMQLLEIKKEIQSKVNSDI